MPVLTNVRHELFAQAIAKGMSAPEAYAQAGYSPDASHGAQLAKNRQVAERIAELLREGALTTGVTVERIAQELAAVAFFDLADVIDWGVERRKPVGVRRGRPSNKPVDGSFVRIRSAAELPALTRRAIAEVKTTMHGVSVKAYDKLTAIRLLGSHLGMWKEQDGEKAGAEALCGATIRMRI